MLKYEQLGSIFSLTSLYSSGILSPDGGSPPHSAFPHKDHLGSSLLNLLWVISTFLVLQWAKLDTSLDVV